VLVLGNLGKDAALALASAGPDQVVIDLARGVARRGAASHAA
jgi:hypothetical protein